MRLTAGPRCCAASDVPQVVPIGEMKTLPGGEISYVRLVGSGGFSVRQFFEPLRGDLELR